eukprot:12322302-Alexandrium_andersonii.AAC.1
MRHDNARTAHEIPMQPAHESLSTEMHRNPKALTDLAQHVEAQAFPEAYYRHPVVRAHPSEK